LFPTLAAGGAWYEDFFGNPKDGVPLTTFEQMAIDGVRSHLKIEKTPCRTFVTLQKNCIPQVGMGKGRKTMWKLCGLKFDKEIPVK
jgi:hypothetical protein